MASKAYLRGHFLWFESGTTTTVGYPFIALYAIEMAKLWQVSRKFHSRSGKPLQQ